MQIFVSGSLAYDRIMDFPERFSDHILPDKIHVLNVCFLVNGMEERFGGTAGNIAYSLTLLGERPLILACAGKDFSEYGEWLKSRGLSLDGIRIIPEEFTASAYITTDKADNQITGFNPGAMKHPSLFSIDGANPADTLAIVAPGNVEDMQSYTAWYQQKQIPYIFDPGQQVPVLSSENLSSMITGSIMLISNDYELEMIKRSTELSLSQILERCGAVITTLGDKGSVVRTKESEVEIPAVRTSQVLDPTGAGDAYRAGLIKGLATGKDLVSSARMGSVSASFSVACQGTQCHLFSENDFWDRYQGTFGALP
ncbi:MAG: carbohydrate kinase family protein [Thermodesulfobacteriota bacterium]